MSEIIETTGLVLRKTPYSETSLIFVLLTRDRGQVHLIAKGALKQGKTRFPAVDLLRLIQVSYRPGKSGLHTAREVELIEDFSRIAAVPGHFRTAMWLARFALQNSVEEDPAAQLFQALHCAFTRLAGPKLESCVPVYLGVMLSALDEHGLLPDLSAHPSKEEAMGEMLAYATDAEWETPVYPDEIWFRLASWTCDHLERTGLRVPDGLEEIQ